MPRYIDIYCTFSSSSSFAASPGHFGVAIHLPPGKLRAIPAAWVTAMQHETSVWMFPKMGYPQLSSIYIDRRFHLETIHFCVPP